MPAIHQQGRTKTRDVVSAAYSHIGVATDQTAFGDGQTVLDPANAGASERLIKSATVTNVDGDTFDLDIPIDGDTEFTGLDIYTIGVHDGPDRDDNISRSLRTNSIGVQAGDDFNVGVRVRITDTS